MVSEIERLMANIDPFTGEIVKRSLIQTIALMVAKHRNDEAEIEELLAAEAQSAEAGSW